MMLISAAASALLLGGCSSVPTTGQASLPTGPISYALSGEHRGLPTVVFQSGLGDDKRVWSQVLPAVRNGNQVFAYDRPGYGSSPAVAGKRDACTIAAEERNVLRAAGVRPPYLLVGHSIGGLYQYVFAKLYPDEVAGIVLLDPTHPQHWASMQRDVPNTAAALKTLGNVLFNSTEQREFDDQASCLDTIDMTRALRMPGRILVSTAFNPLMSASFKDMASKLFVDWARMTGANGVEAVPDSGHYIQNDRPQAVIKAISSVAEQLRGKAAH